MVNKILPRVALSLLILLSGCSTTEGESRLAIEKMLDDANYEGVISALETNADEQSEYMALGAAYMGRARATLPLLFSAMSSEEEENLNSEFAIFIKNITQDSSPTALSDLSKASSFYKKVSEDICTTFNIDRSDSQKDICLFLGLGKTTAAAITVGLLVGDISSITDININDSKLQASACAIEYAFNGEYSESSCSVNEELPVNFSSLNNKAYTPLTITSNSSEYTYLLSEESKIILTDGFCSLDDFTTRVAVQDSITAPYLCPLSEDPAGDFSVSDLLIEGLNEGLDSIKSALTTEIQEDIDKYREEITGDVNGVITEAAIIKYLNERNGD